MLVFIIVSENTLKMFAVVVGHIRHELFKSTNTLTFPDRPKSMCTVSISEYLSRVLCFCVNKTRSS